MDHLAQIRCLAADDGEQGAIDGSKRQHDVRLNFIILWCWTLVKRFTVIGVNWLFLII